MEARDFLYRFTETLFSEIVKETILIENWEESDFDYRYAEYVKIFQNMLEACLTKGSTDEVLTASLNTSRKKVISLFNKRMKDSFIAQLASHEIGQPGDVEKLIPPDLFDGNAIRTDILSIFRTLEEEILQGKKREAS
jgi:hypothetical protein